MNNSRKKNGLTYVAAIIGGATLFTSLFASVWGSIDSFFKIDEIFTIANKTNLLRVFSLVLPLLGGIVGMIVAYYFIHENLDSARNSVEKIKQQSDEELRINELQEQLKAAQHEIERLRERDAEKGHD